MRASRCYCPRSYPRSSPRPCRRRPMVTAHGADRLGTSRLGCLAAAAAVAEAAISAAATGATTAAAARRRARISCRCTRRAPCITCGGRRRARAGRGGHARCLRVDRAAPDDARGPRARAVLGAARRRAARVRDLRGCSWLCRVCARWGGGNSRLYVYTFARLCQPCPGGNSQRWRSCSRRRKLPPPPDQPILCTSPKARRTRDGGSPNTDTNTIYTCDARQTRITRRPQIQTFGYAWAYVTLALRARRSISRRPPASKSDGRALMIYAKAVQRARSSIPHVNRRRREQRDKRRNATGRRDRDPVLDIDAQVPQRVRSCLLHGNRRRPQ